MRRDAFSPLAVFVPFLLLVFALIVASELAPVACASKNSDSANCFDYWLNRYQTLVSGLFALGAALIGAVFLYKQISLADRQEAERIKRKHAAARSMLPLALGQICRSSEENAQAIRATIVHIRRYKIAPVGVIKAKNQKIDGYSLQILSEFIEFMPHSESHVIFKIVSQIQLYEARLSRILVKLDQLRSDHIDDLMQCAADCVLIYCYASSIIGYARRETEEISDPNSLNEYLFMAAHVMGFLEEDIEMLEKHFRRK